MKPYERDFAQKVYCKWARKEIHKMIRENKDVDPIQVVSSFILKMDKYACYGESSSYMFSVARDEGEWFLDLLSDPAKNTDPYMKEVIL